MSLRFPSFAILAAMFLLLVSCADRKAPTTVDGVLDLRGVDLESRTLALEGPWQVRMGELVSPDSAATARFKMPQGMTTSFPTTWKQLASSDSNFRDIRHAAFLLTLLADSTPGRNIRLTMPQFIHAYQIWVDGSLVDFSQAPGKDLQSESSPGIRGDAGSFPLRSRHRIVVQISSYQTKLRDHIPAPTLEVVSSRPTHRINADLRQAAIAGIMGFLALYNLVFLTLMLRERSYLYFGLFCLFWGADCVFDGSGHPLTNLAAPLRIPLCVLAVLGAVCALVYHTESKLPSRILSGFNKIFLIYSIVLGMLVVFAPSVPAVLQLFGIYLVTCLAPFALLCHSTLRALWKKEPGSLLSATGVFCLLFSWGHDALTNLGLFPSGVIWGLYGGLCLAICESFALGVRFSRTHRQNTQLLSEVQAKNEELGRLSRLKDDFLANTSHELRTPLHGIYGLTQAILSDARIQLSQEIRRSLEHVQGSARRLTRLVNDILDFAKIRHHDLSIRTAPLDLSVALPTIPPHFQSAAETKGIDLRCEIDPDLPRVMADEDRLVQILFNLVGNAIKFTDWGSVTLTARRKDDGVEIAVADTGIGIDRLAQERIFEPFEQAEGIHRGGTGLGLSITRKLVELHGSSLTLESAPSKGSTFSFALPLATENDLESPTGATTRIPNPRAILQTGPESSANETDSSTGSFERWVLAIDDEPVNLLVLKNLLNAQDIGVITAPDGRRSLELIREHDPEVVLLDVMMPFKDGYEVCADIRRAHSSADLPVLFLSARSRLEDVIHGFTAGGNDYVLKPFLGQELVARVHAQMRQREVVKALRENRSLKVELADLALEKSQIDMVKNRLTSLFHGMDEPILVVDSSWQIRFANQQAGRILSESPEHLVERMLSELVEAPPSLPPHASGSSIELALGSNRLRSAWRVTPFQDGDEGLWALSQEVSTDPAPRGGLSRLVIQKLAQSEDRLGQLREQMDLLSTDLQMDLPIGELQSTLSQIRSLVADQPDEALRLTRASELLNDALELWCAATGRSKADLAEESGLWAVHVDPNGWRRTATLDKYLDPGKIPKLPKWKTIFKTVEFVCRRISPDPRAAKLLEKSDALSGSGFLPISQGPFPKTNQTSVRCVKDQESIAPS